MFHSIKWRSRWFGAGLALCAFLPMAPGLAQAQVSDGRPISAQDAAAKEEYAYSVAVQAYVFTHPLTMLERERKLRLRLNASNPDEPLAPINQIGHLRRLANAKGRLPYSPNNDTAYSGILLELKDGPVVLHLPTVLDRFWVLTSSDSYTRNMPYVLGTRVSGGQGGEVLYAGPDWKGELPRGMKFIRLPSNTGIALIRTRVDDDADLPKVIEIQNQMSLTALADWDNGRGMGKKVAPIPKLMDRPSYKGDFAYFRTVADLLAENPPAPEHASALKMFELIGLQVGKPFNPEALDEPTRKGVLRAEKVGFDIVKWSTRVRGVQLASNWGTDLFGGQYGYDYLARAELAYSGLVTNDPEDAMYFLSYADGNGKLLEGGKRYRIHFAKGQLPPVNPRGFWSLTMYGGDTFQFVDNPINRFAVGSRTKGLKFNDDGSLDIHIQPESPGADKESNWLPSPKSGSVRLNIRAYYPAPEMLKVENMPKFLPPIQPVTD